MASTPNSWTTRQAPSLDDLNAIAAEAFASLPPKFRSLAGDLVISITDFPDAEVLKDMKIDSPFELLGLFQGVGLAQSGGAETGHEPNRIWLFRRPILDYWAEYEESLGAVVSHVLIHEIGHHFGLSDEDMEAIEASAD